MIENYNNNSENRLTKEIKDKLGKDFIFRVEYMIWITKTKRDKLRFVVSEMNE